MEEFKPDLERWKRPYEPVWPKHKEEVLRLKTKLENDFPELKGAIGVGLGADTDEYLKIPPTKKGEPDLILHKDFKPFSWIEVSGTDKKEVRDFIWIRPDKFELAEPKETDDKKTWFYMVYPNGIYVLTVKDITPFKDNIHTVSPYGLRERYIFVPFNVGKTPSIMFSWIEKQIKRV